MADQQPDPGRPLDEVAGIEADGAVVTPFDDGGLSDDVVNALWDAMRQPSGEDPRGRAPPRP